MEKPRILIAGIGNIFLGDDGFGVEVVQRLARRALPTKVRVTDFGIRGFDLAYALMEDYDLAILVDAVSRGGPAGTLYVIEPTLDDTSSLAAGEVMVETHGMNPMKVLQMVQTLGGRLPPLRLVGCVPESLGSEEDPVMGLSATVHAAVEEAIRLIESLVAEILNVPGSLVQPWTSENKPSPW